MKITQIDVYQVNYKLLDEKYAWSRDQAVTSFISTIVRISTDEGLKGFAEVCPLGSAYMDAYAQGVPSGIKEIGPLLLGQDPCQINVINGLMDFALTGHNYIKSPLDIACWDILGQASSVPVCTLLGGRCVNSFPLYRAVSQGSAKQMADDVSRFREEGYRRFQLKVGGDPDEDIKRIKAVLKVIQTGDILVADANTGWLMHKAIRVVNALAGENLYIEQPCQTLEECLVVREHTRLPMVLDEVIKGIGPLLTAYNQRAMDVVNIKISRLGGLARARQMRDLCESLGVAMTLEDSWGGDITTAAIAHLVGSTRPEFYFTSTDFNSYNDVHLAEDAPKRKDGSLEVPSEPGLGIHVDEKKLGKPVLTLK
ncbi:MAG: mandelate racemase/muconate lactonizing enzyme family protein [Candidatus Aminicenantes bacterium]|nr:mandelate racemase/muconate lactonizing enzyme family protein [Candidatus Aminicenantes bacterium]